MIELEKIDKSFTVCKTDKIPQELLRSSFCFIGKTDNELSLVCETSLVPSDVLCREDGWGALRVVGVLDFSLVGILAPIASVLAKEQIGIFALSTYDTDYILCKEENISRACLALQKAGYTVKESV